MTDSGRLLRVDDLVVEHPVRSWRRPPLRAVRGVSIDVRAGETVGLVGESGAGKTTLARAILGLTPIVSGSIRFNGTEIGGYAPARRSAAGIGIQAVFQDPHSSLNPAMNVEEALIEPLTAGRRRSGRDSRNLARDLLDRVGIPSDAAHRLPQDLSGGQLQRIAIARALACSPHLIVCDEPVSALDLSTQARILSLLTEIQDATRVAYLFISHDLAVIRHISHRIAVMRAGEIVEFGGCAAVSTNPAHPYTRRLLMAAPVTDPLRQRERRERRATPHR